MTAHDMNAHVPARAAHRFVDHTGEVAIEVDAPSMVEAFLEAACGLRELVAGDQPLTATGATIRVRVSAPDLERLLVAWLDELIYASEVHKLVMTDIRIEHLDSRHLEASVRGAPPKFLKTQVKAATLHGIELSEDARGVHARMVLDV